MNRLTIPAVLAALALGAIACEEKKAEPKSAADKISGAIGDAAKKAGDAAKDAGAKASEAAKGATASMGDQMNEWMKGGAAKVADGFNAKLAEWKPKVDELKAKAGSLPEAVKPQAETAVKAIEDQWKSVEGMISKLKSASADQLKGLSGDTMSGVEKLGKMITDAAGKYLK